MNENRLFALMMRAIDGECTAAESAELEHLLADDPEEARLWQAMQAVDLLFQQTPAVAPPANLAARTLARLPHSNARLWFGLFYMLLLFSGLVPIGLLVWGYIQYGPLLGGVPVLGVLVATFGNLWQIVQVIFGAFITSLVDLLRQQPQLMGWLTILVGIVLTWLNVYRQLTEPAVKPALAPSRTG